MKSTSRLFAVLILLAVLWTPVNLMVKTAIPGFSPGAIALIRWSTFSVMLWAMLSSAGIRTALQARIPSRRDLGMSALCGALLIAPAHALYYASLTRTTTVETVVILTSAPLWVAVFAVFFLKERISSLRWIAVCMAFVGSYVTILGFGVPHWTSSHTIGNLMFLGGVLLECIGGVLVTRIVIRSSGLGALAGQTTGMGISFLFMCAFVPDLSFQVTWVGAAPVLAMLYLILIASMVCFTTWYTLVQNAPLSLMVISIGVQAPLGALLGWWQLGEPIEVRVLVGAAIILAGLMLGAMDRSSRADQRSVGAAAAAEA